MPKPHALPHYLRVALALSSSTVGCAGGRPSPTSSLSSADAGVTETSTTSIVSGDKGDGPISKVDDYTSGDGPCRCSWDTNVSGAPRVCKKGETSYSGNYCMPRKRKYYPPMIGPLQPPYFPC